MHGDNNETDLLLLIIFKYISFLIFNILYVLQWILIILPEKVSIKKYYFNDFNIKNNLTWNLSYYLFV